MLTPPICSRQIGSRRWAAACPLGKPSRWLGFMPARRAACAQIVGQAALLLAARLRWLFLVLAYCPGALSLLGGCASRTLIPKQ